MKNSIFATILAVVTISISNPLFSQTFRSLMYDPPGMDDGDYEYVEIEWTPNTSLSGIWIMYIDGDAANAGTTRVRRNLSTYSTGANGLLLVHNTNNNAIVFTPAADPATNEVYPADFNWQNDSGTFLLVSGTPPTDGTDLDTDDNGTLDVGALSGLTILAAISVFDNDAGDFAYADEITGGTVLPDIASFKMGGFFLAENEEFQAINVTGTNPGPYSIDQIWDATGATPAGATLPTTLTPGSTKAPLPIELVAFAGRKVGSQVQLYWETATEKNNALMEIERSADGQVFSKIGEKKPYGDGNSLALQRYEFTDYQPLPGLNYYRLRQLDLGGKDTYHKTIAILFDEVKNEEGVRVFPSPAAETLHFALAQETTATGTIRVLDMSGRAMLQLPLPIGIQQDQMDISSLPQGQYILSIQAGRTSYNIKFAKL